jgi:hypothetical protein
MNSLPMQIQFPFHFFMLIKSLNGVPHCPKYPALALELRRRPRLGLPSASPQAAARDSKAAELQVRQALALNLDIVLP